MSTTLKTLHDRLLEERPDDATHVASDCPFCVDAAEIASANLTGGSVADTKTYTEEEHAALLAQVADLTAKIAELTTATATSQTDAAVAAAKAELEAQISDLQAKLDTAVLEAQAAKEDRDATVSYLEGEAAAVEAAAAIAARKDERMAKVKEVASFPDEYLTENADRFAAMSDEEFEKALEDWKVIAPKKAGSTDDKIPAKTAMTAASTSTNTPSPLSEVMDLRFSGVDVRSVH